VSVDDGYSTKSFSDRAKYIVRLPESFNCFSLKLGHNYFISRSCANHNPPVYCIYSWCDFAVFWGRIVAPININLTWRRHTYGAISPVKFCADRCEGVEWRFKPPKLGKCCILTIFSPQQVNSLGDFYEISAVKRCRQAMMTFTVWSFLMQRKSD